MTSAGMPYPAIVRWLAILSLGAIATGVAVNFRHPYLMDFLSYWGAAVLTISGHASEAYDVARHHTVQEQVFEFHKRMPFAYPPPYLLVILPFGFIPYALAASTWIGTTMALYTVAVRRWMPDFLAAAIAFPPVAVCGIVGQNGFLTAALFIGGMSVFAKQPFLAGAILGSLAIKPQLGLLLPLALIAGREWRAFAGAATTVIGFILLSLIAFGLASWRGFLNMTPLVGSITTEGLVGWYKMASVFASLRLAGVPAPFAWAIHAGCAALAATLVWRFWRGTSDAFARAAILAPASALVSPYLYLYDQVMLVISFYWLVRSGANRGLLIALFLLPLATLAQFWLPNPSLNLAPLVPLSLMLLVWYHSKSNAEVSGNTNTRLASTENSLSRE